MTEINMPKKEEIISLIQH